MSATSRLDFDLIRVQPSQKQMLFWPRVIAIAGAVLLALLDIRGWVTPPSPLSDPARLAIVVVTLLFAAFLSWASVVWLAAGPIRLEVDSSTARFTFASGKVSILRWNDPGVDVSVVDMTTTAWNKAGAPRPVPMYFLGERRWTYFALTAEAGAAILGEARRRSLSLTPGVGTGSLFKREYGHRQTHIRGSAAAAAHRAQS